MINGRERYTMNDELLTKKNAGDLHVTGNPPRICPGKIKVPTEEERKALGAMKSIKEQVRASKKRLASLHTSANDEKADEIRTVENEQARLKAEWDQWEEKRKAAAKERMIILGHEEGPI
jgi:hypothetical protein